MNETRRIIKMKFDQKDMTKNERKMMVEHARLEAVIARRRAKNKSAKSIDAAVDALWRHQALMSQRGICAL